MSAASLTVLTMAEGLLEIGVALGTVTLTLAALAGLIAFLVWLEQPGQDPDPGRRPGTARPDGAADGRTGDRPEGRATTETGASSRRTP